MKALILPCGQTALVDDEDFERVSTEKWHVNHGYVVRRVRHSDGTKTALYMHREVMGEFEGFDIDHADGNKLNNTRANLRLATRTDNNANSKPRAGCSSVYKGVAWLKGCKRWMAYIRKSGKRTYLGYFTDEIEAAKAYNRAAIEMFGEFARPNHIPSPA